MMSTLTSTDGVVVPPECISLGEGQHHYTIPKLAKGAHCNHKCLEPPHDNDDKKSVESCAESEQHQYNKKQLYRLLEIILTLP